MIMEKSCTIQDVFERFYPSYEKRNSPPAHHRKTAYHIMNCKTGAFGVNISVCEDCGCISIHNNSCRSRCCPMCQEFPKEKWIDAQKENVLDTTVTYAVKDYKNEGHWKEKTISGEEFIRRFMMHVPPKRFVRIRHYGLLSCRNKRKKITLCRNLLGCKKYISTLKNLNAVEMIKVLYHIDVCKCSSCGGNMVSPCKDKYSSSFRAHMRC